jgi:antitoxin HicB
MSKSSADCCEETTMRRYSVVLIPDPVDGGYAVLVPTLPGCITEGDTVDEALDNARDAVRSYLADVQASGEPMPEEKAPPCIQLTAVEV